MSRSSSFPTSMQALLADIVRQKKWQGRFELHQLFARWQALVGMEIAQHAVPSLFRGRVLWVDVSDSIWLQQLQFLKSELLGKLNGALQGERVEDIRFQLNSDLLWAAEPQKQVQAHSSPPPDAAQQQAMDDLLKSVPDAELRQAMKNCWFKFHSLPGRQG